MKMDIEAYQHVQVDGDSEAQCLGALGRWLEDHPDWKLEGPVEIATQDMFGTAMAWHARFRVERSITLRGHPAPAPTP